MGLGPCPPSSASTRGESTKSLSLPERDVVPHVLMRRSEVAAVQRHVRVRHGDAVEVQEGRLDDLHLVLARFRARRGLGGESRIQPLCQVQTELDEISNTEIARPFP